MADDNQEQQQQQMQQQLVQQQELQRYQQQQQEQGQPKQSVQQQILQQQQQQQYQQLAQSLSPKPPLLRNIFWAFIVGGLICTFGEGVLKFCLSQGMAAKEAAAATSAIMIFLGAFLTGLGIYDKIGAFAGAGSIVPITGFANSIVSSAMEFKREGYVLGVGARMFTVAGPVIVYGTVAAFFVGLIEYLTH